MSEIMEKVTKVRNLMEEALDEADQSGRSVNLMVGFVELALIQKRTPEDSCERVLVENLIPTYLRDFVRIYPRLRSNDSDPGLEIAVVLVLTEDYMETSINRGDDELKENYYWCRDEFDGLRGAFKNRFKVDKEKLLSSFG